MRWLDFLEILEPTDESQHIDIEIKLPHEPLESLLKQHLRLNHFGVDRLIFATSDIRVHYCIYVAFPAL